MQFLINDSVRESIDFDYVLNKVEVITPYGKEYKRKLQPFMPGDEEKLRDEFNRLEKIIKFIKEKPTIFTQLKNNFYHIKDLRNTIARCIGGYTLTVVELFEIKQFVFFIKEIHNSLLQLRWDIPEDINVMRILEIEKLLDPEGKGIKTFYIYDDYSDELTEIRKSKRDIEKEIKLKKKKIREELKKELKINIRPDNQVIVNKSDSDVIERLNNHPSFVYCSENYMNITFRVKHTQDIDELESSLEELKKEEEQEELKIRQYLSENIAKYEKEIYKNINAIAKLDFTVAKAYMAMAIGGVKPIITDHNTIEISEGRHLKVEERLNKQGKKFTPISVKLNKGVTCITGANMGGKTVSLKLIGLLVTMVQYGFYVPCTKIQMSLRDFVYISVGDNQSSDMGLSTFGAEINSIQKAIKNSYKKGLILIDELARGTNPEEGYAISKGVVNYLKDKSSITVITTHYDNVANIDKVVHLQVIGLSNVDYERLKEELYTNNKLGIDVISKYMDYRLKRVTTSKEVPKDAINIARLMGLDERILKDAEKILSH
ncbi:MutS-related protein [Caldisalinibacter kiritimatiensis]|uniref:MutS domain protein, family 2 n=1 Tax=Caldisalinibacter kiritimatiensis TaxID=1304284 RepID=R1AYA8_9FIRM|nr:MutS domain protein, family 2 [Caldisalinibacter kiritimatiensis]EOD01672.1 MutS domain protein, family 2 [Caldisalinibacter kiritimatiensis]